jgi:tRNA(Ile)-lysidine synthase
MNGFVRSLITEWRRLDLPFDDRTVVVAVSGGADSVSLLMAMQDLRQMEKLNLRLVAAHFDHGLRGAESDADKEFVQRLTAEHGIEFAIGHGDIDRAGNLEQNARNARYAFLEKTAHSVNGFAVLTGHTINDQAETFLMNLIRGSGVDGLSGMRTVREMGSWGEGETRRRGEAGKRGQEVSPVLPLSPSPVLLIRPLLRWAKRGDTEQYCQDLGIKYRYDSMNEDTAFKRVRIRKILLPLLTDMNPNIIETLANTAELMQHASEGNAVGLTEPVPVELDLKFLRRLERSDRYRVLRRWLTVKRGTARQLDLKHIRSIDRLVLSEKSGRTVELPGGGHVVRSGGKLAFGEN